MEKPFPTFEAPVGILRLSLEETTMAFDGHNFSSWSTIADNQTAQCDSSTLLVNVFIFCRRIASLPVAKLGDRFLGFCNSLRPKSSRCVLFRV